MSKLETMHRLARREAVKLGVNPDIVRVEWAPGKGQCKLPRYGYAHIHIRGNERGLIHIRRGLKDWRDCIKHEVAHLVPGGRHNGLGFLRARAKQGSLKAKATLAQRGKGRCPGHSWYQSRLLSETITRRGLVRIYQAACSICGKRVPTD